HLPWDTTRPACTTRCARAWMARSPRWCSRTAPVMPALASRLAELAPGHLSRCVFTTSGAETVEAAIKLTRARTGRDLILSASGSFHGQTTGALALTGQPQYAEGFGPLAPGFERVPFGDADAVAEVFARHGE